MSLLCPEIQQVLRAELKQGNILYEEPMRTDWPRDGSVFAALEKDFTQGKNTGARVKFTVDNDPHYGWYEACVCPIHHHLLVSGSCRHEE